MYEQLFDYGVAGAAIAAIVLIYKETVKTLKCSFEKLSRAIDNLSERIESQESKIDEICGYIRYKGGGDA